MGARLKWRSEADSCMQQLRTMMARLFIEHG